MFILPKTSFTTTSKLNSYCTIIVIVIGVSVNVNDDIEVGAGCGQTTTTSTLTAIPLNTTHGNQLIIQRVSEIGGTVRCPRPRTWQTLGRSPPQSSVVGALSAYPPPFSSVLVLHCQPIIPCTKIQPGGGANNNQNHIN